MEIGRVIGTVVSTRKHERLVGSKIQVVQPLEPHSMIAEGQPFVAVDAVGAGVGEQVLIARGSAARKAVDNESAPVGCHDCRHHRRSGHCRERHTLTRPEMGKIYTRKGDLGMSSLFSGEKVSKDDIRLEAYGALDELQAQLGLARALVANEEIPPILTEVARDISIACTELASGSEVRARLVRRLDHGDTQRLESYIDSFTARFPLPNHFILPGCTADSAALHVARTVCRRAERRIVGVNRELGGYDEILVYFNRLSDLLFTLAWSLQVNAVVDDVVRDVLAEARK